MGHRFHKTPLTITLTEVWCGFTGLGSFNRPVESTREYEVNSLSDILNKLLSDHRLLKNGGSK